MELTATAPEKVFLNHYFALDTYIQTKADLDSVFTRSTYQDSQRAEVNIRALSKLLLNSWSAEYALRITPVVNDEQYLQSSLHWTFPQAYYSVLFSARAFLLSQGCEVSNEDKIRKEVAKRVRNEFYPASVSFFMYGSIGSYKVQNLYFSPPYDAYSSGYFGLRLSLGDTRSKQITNTAVRAVKTEPIRRGQLKDAATQLGPTTYFDLMQRLRISSTNREIERFVDSEIDVRSFHTSLINIVNHINAVHEIYIAKVIGVQAYSELFKGLPRYLSEGFAGERWEKNQPF